MIHLRSCNKAHGRPDDAPSKGGMSPNMNGSGLGKSSPSSSPAIIKRPKTIICYIW